MFLNIKNMQEEENMKESLPWRWFLLERKWREFRDFREKEYVCKMKMRRRGLYLQLEKEGRERERERWLTFRREGGREGVV